MNATPFFQRRVQRWRAWLQRNPQFPERTRALIRLLFFLLFPPLFALLGMIIFEQSNPYAIAEKVREGPLFARFYFLPPTWLVMLFTPLTKWVFARHLLAPVGACLLILLASALYVQQLYDIEEFFPALRYIISSMFGLFYPKIEVEGGKLVIPEGRINVLDKIGGPGFVHIHPGNAVMFQTFRQPSNTSLSGRYFMKPFETFGPIADLTDQHGHRDEVWAVTRDGIQLNLRDINFRYRMMPLTREDGGQQARTISNPYPFSQDAMLDCAYNRSAGETWAGAVSRTVVGEITEFISRNEIDFLTAPKETGQEPRRNLRMQLFTEGISRRLQSIGTELIWVDVGHLEILEISEVMNENVDGQRFAYWASRYIGNANITLAQGEATRMALQERGRVEAQAELLQGITESLRGLEQANNPIEHLRKIILIRTAQILEGIGVAGRLPKEKE